MNSTTGTYTTTIPSPTNIASDPALAAYGVDQARQLASKIISLDPPVDVVYSSPFYRCLQTLGPTVEALQEKGRGMEPGSGKGGEGVRVEHGIRYTLYRFHSYSQLISPTANSSAQHALHTQRLHRFPPYMNISPTSPPPIDQL